jgi:hypothetical protein
VNALQRDALYFVVEIDIVQKLVGLFLLIILCKDKS